MNIHTQQTDCEAEIAAGARGLGPRRPTTARWNGHYSSGWGDGRRSQAPQLLPEHYRLYRPRQKNKEDLTEIGTLWVIKQK